jgi:iron complex outermembrane receptor protein
MAGHVRAEDELGEVVVTAPPIEETPEVPPEDPTAFGAVIDAEQAATSVETLSDLLSEAVGVQVRRFGGLGDFSTVSVRGFSAGQVQVYLDGVPLSRADNETVNLSDLPLDLVDRVEVYRSATPLAFAQSGPGGVVNVVTREPPRDRPLWAASASGESFGTRKVDLAHGAAHGSWEYLGFLNYLGSEGDFEFTNDLGTTANPDDERRETRQNNAFDQVGGLLRARYRTDADAVLTMTSDSFWKQEGVPGAQSRQALHTELETTRELLQLGLDLPSLGTLPITLAGQAYGVYQHVAFDDPDQEIGTAGVVRQRDDSLAAGGQVVGRGALGDHQLLGLLVAIGHEQFWSKEWLVTGALPESEPRRIRGTIAGEDEIVLLGERVSIVPSLRWEIARDDFPGIPETDVNPAEPGSTQVQSFFSPRLGVSVRPTTWLTLLGNMGRSTRIPNLDELFGTRGAVQGNPDLKPERAETWDVGTRLSPPAWGPFDALAIEYAYFDSTIDDLIALTQNSQFIARPVNIGKAALSGHEVTARGRAIERVALTLNYTRQNTRNESDFAAYHGNQLPGRPRDEFYARLEVGCAPERPIPGLAWAAPLRPRVYGDVNLIAGNYLDESNDRGKFVDNRTLYGAGVSFGLPWTSFRPLRLTFEVRNIGDDSTQDVYGFWLPGRTFSGTLAWGFGGSDAP